MSSVVYVKRNVRDVDDVVEAVMERIGVHAAGRVVLKPNLINEAPPPTTTPPDIVEALARWFLAEGCEVVVAEGSGWGDTMQAFRKLGYVELEGSGVKLVDLNFDSYFVVENPEAYVLKRFELPATLKDAYVVSVPVLKEHSITKVTLSLKNMLGATLGEGRIAKKGRFHRIGLDESIVDVNIHVKPRLAFIDGRTAGIGGELSSKPKDVGVIIASKDLVAADAMGAKILGYDPSSVRHLRLAEEKGIGVASLDRVRIVEL
nr:DUF362 domain-containing protein [Candidatus Freyrarchaeum guaymaensis]